MGIELPHLPLEDLVCGNVPPRAGFAIKNNRYPLGSISERGSPSVRGLSVDERGK